MGRWGYTSPWLLSALSLAMLSGCDTAEPNPQPAELRIANVSSGRADLSILDDHGDPITLASSAVHVTVEERRSPSESWRLIPDVSIDLEGTTRLDVAVVADNSGSETGQLVPMQVAAHAFSESIYQRQQPSRMALVRVSTTASVIQELTESSIQFDAALDQLHVGNGWTALWDGIRAANEVLQRGLVVRQDAAENHCVDASMRALVVFTDGRENNSSDQHDTVYAGDGVDTTLRDLARMRVFGARTPVFIIGVGDAIDRDILAAIARESGAMYRHIDDYAGLLGALDAVTQRLSASAPICFQSAADSTELRITVEIQGSEEDGGTVRFQQVLAFPADSCTVPEGSVPRLWQPLRPLVPCSVLGEVDDLDTEALVSIADVGCDPGSGGTPHYVQAQLSTAAVQYAPPTHEERAMLRQRLPGFYAALRSLDADLSTYTAAFASAGLAMAEYTSEGASYVVVYDGLDTWRGAGGYLFRRGPVVSEIIIQAPHSYYEPSTGSVADYVVGRQPVRGFFFNTLHRHFLIPGATCNGEVYPADVVHVTNSFFHLFSVEFLNANPDGTLVQLHGFSNPTLELEQIGTVVSSGTFEPSVQVRALRQGLASQVGGAAVALYPEDTNLYGATLNIQGRWVQDNLRGNFVHIEMSKSVRRALVSQPDTLARFSAALHAATR